MISRGLISLLLLAAVASPGHAQTPSPTSPPAATAPIPAPPTPAKVPLVLPTVPAPTTPAPSGPGLSDPTVAAAWDACAKYQVGMIRTPHPGPRWDHYDAAHDASCKIISSKFSSVPAKMPDIHMTPSIPVAAQHACDDQAIANGIGDSAASAAAGAQCVW